MEQERVALLSEVKKRNNVQTIRQKMGQTFAFRRQEIVNKKTSLHEMIERWPALFEVQEDTDTTTKREIALKCLILNMGESVEDLSKEFLVSEKEEAGQILQRETIAIFVIRDAQAATKDIGIILEGQEVVNKLASVANAVAILLGFLYALNLEYPKTLKFTF
ncbi:DNA helicase/primase complex-associated protein [Dissostichus eleginoides]|uniref:DNA helicase/primase complex-associated protein n=1 Tax=Dissostichus eleginoides TaxID=100907 RepID=A0AAD9FC35_DISEL|nr:DNA helicase/primase complex-associated protein [Dissostichus eleginoides]